MRSTIRGLLIVATLGALTAIASLNSGCAMLGMHTGKAVSVQAIVQMSNDKVSSDEIIRQIKVSGTVYRLKASQLADLKNRGVSDTVIDYMQQTYLDAVKRDSEYQNWSHWRMYDDYWYGGVPYGWPYDRVYIIRETGRGAQSGSDKD